MAVEYDVTDIRDASVTINSWVYHNPPPVASRSCCLRLAVPPFVAGPSRRVHAFALDRTPCPPLSLSLSSKVPRVPCRQMQFNVAAPSRVGRPYARPVATTFCRVSPRTVSRRPPRRMAATRAYFLFSFSSSMCRLRVVIL